MHKQWVKAAIKRRLLCTVMFLSVRICVGGSIIEMFFCLRTRCFAVVYEIVCSFFSISYLIQTEKKLDIVHIYRFSSGSAFGSYFRLKPEMTDPRFLHPKVHQSGPPSSMELLLSPIHHFLIELEN